MPSDTEIANPSPAPVTKKGPGRPHKAATETPQQRIERLQAELHQAQEAKKRADERQATIVGAAVLRHARANGDFRRQIAAILRTEVKVKADLAALADMLSDPPPP